MRLVNLEEFLKLPANTIFAKYDGVFGVLEIKQKNVNNEFYVSPLGVIEDTFLDPQNHLEKGYDIGVDFDYWSTSECFDHDQMFVVFNRRDTRALFDAVKKCLDVFGEEE